MANKYERIIMKNESKRNGKSDNNVNNEMKIIDNENK